MAMGRPPKPTHMKILEGNPGKRPINKSEPKPKATIPPCPRHLSKEAKAEWRRISKELATLGLLTAIDRAALGGYCAAYARWAQAEEAMQAEDFKMVEVTDKGYSHVNAWFIVANNSLKQMRAFLTEFGMTPSARSRVTVPEAKDIDPYEEFRQRRKAS